MRRGGALHSVALRCSGSGAIADEFPRGRTYNVRPQSDMTVTAHHVCPWWFAYTFDHPLRRLIQPPEKLLAPYVRDGTRAIDVGCGMGYFSIAMARLGANVVAVDLQQKMLDVLAKRAVKKGVRDRIALRLADESSLYLDGRADFALAFWMLHEVPERGRLLREVREVL